MGLAARFVLVGSALTALLPSAYGAADEVSPGSPAPKLSIKTWLKGTPITELEPDKTYVVEFWATWCGPCIDSIPHVTKLAKANTDVTFIGVGIWEDDVNGNLKKFVDKMGDKMDYNVGYSGNQEGMAKTWMTAAGQNGIPTAFVVKNGNVMWIGHPMGMDKPLAEIKAGTFDLKAFKAKFDKNAEATRKEMAAYEAMRASDAQFKAGKRAEAKQAMAKVVAANPQMASAAESFRFDWLATENPKAWEAKAKAMAAGKKPSQLQMLTSFALNKAQEPSGAEISRKAIGIALKATAYKDFNTLWYASEVYKKTQDDKLALNVTKRLLAMYPKSPVKDNPDFKAKLVKDKTELEAKLLSAKN